MDQFPADDRFGHGREAIVSETASASGGVRVLFPILLVYCVISIAITAIYPAAALSRHISNDFGEGWNAYWAQAIQRGLPLYSASRTFTANNYPPLSFYANAALGSVIGDNIIAGRLIASASMIGLATLLARIAVTLGAPARWGLLLAAIFLLYNLFFLRQMVAVDNPQWLGELIGLASILPLIRRSPSSLKALNIVSASATMVIAGLVKHNQLALPMAITVWLLIFDRRALLVWCISGACFAGIACAALYGIYGQAVFVELFRFQRTMNLPAFEHGFAKLGDFVPLIAVASLTLRWQDRDERVMLLLLYAIFGVVFGVLQRLGSGVYINAYDDALIGLIAVCGAVMGPGAAGRNALLSADGRRAALIIALLVPIMIAMPKRVRQSITDFSDLDRQETIWKGMIADVRDARGPVLCELPAVCYWAGRPLTVDFFAYGQKLRLGADPGPLHRMIAQRVARVIVVDHDVDTPPDERRLPPPFPALIDERYRVTRLAIDHVATMVPRT